MLEIVLTSSINDVGTTFFFQNAETLKRMWLLQESITHPTTGFGTFVNKKLTFKCFIDDVGTTILSQNAETPKRTWLL